MKARIARVRKALVLTGLALTLIVGGIVPLMGGNETAAKNRHRKPRPTANPTAISRTRTETLTRVFATTRGIQIPNSGATIAIANPYPSTIVVSGFTNARMTDVNLRLRNVNHDFPEQFDIMLVKGTTSTMIVSNAGGNNKATSLDLGFDDEVGSLLPDVETIVSGAYRPSAFGTPATFESPAPAASGNASLAAFDGLDPNGEWRLFVIDDFGKSEPGLIDSGWELEITAQITETTPVIYSVDGAKQPKAGKKGGKHGKKGKGKR